MTPHRLAAVMILLAAGCGKSNELGDSRAAAERGVPDGTLDRSPDAAGQPDRSIASPDTQKPPPPAKDGGKPPAGDKGAKPLKDWGASDAGALAYQCLWNTKSEAECKDCCDCIGLACGDAAPCRDACPTHDFAKNTSFITLTVKSVLDANADYSTCTAKGNQQLCKECCACGASLECGDTRFCRDQCNKLPANP